MAINLKKSSFMVKTLATAGAVLFFAALLTAVVACQDSFPDSDLSTATTATTAPAGVSGLSATTGNGQAVLAWTDPADSGFAQVRITFSPTAAGVTQPITVSAGTQTATITGLTNGTEYTFTVETVNTAGKTSTRTSAKAKPGANTAPGAETPGAETPVISQPAGRSYAARETALALTVTASVSDGGTLSYQWFSNTADSNSGGTSLGAAAQTASYTPPTAAVGTVWYYVVVTNTNTGVSGTQTATATSSTAKIVVQAIVYVAGFEAASVGRDHKEIATVWRNGSVLYRLTDGTKTAEALSVYVSGRDVYVAGYESKNTDSLFYEAYVWKNGEVQYYLAAGTGKAVACSVYVSGDQVYAAGYRQQILNGSKAVAAVWRNGVAYELTDGTTEAVANSVYVSGNDFYAGGVEKNGSGKFVATVWKNRYVLYRLTDGTKNASVNSIYVSGSDVYAAGYDTNADGMHVGKVWKNGVELYNSLTDFTGIADAVYVSGSDVYTAGSDARRTDHMDVSKVWKNGTLLYINPIFSTMIYGRARSIYVSGSDVYAAGEEGNSDRGVATVWKNGVATSLTDGTKDAKAFSVYVVES